MRGDACECYRPWMRGSARGFVRSRVCVCVWHPHVGVVLHAVHHALPNQAEWWYTFTMPGSHWVGFGRYHIRIY